MCIRDSYRHVPPGEWQDLQMTKSFNQQAYALLSLQNVTWADKLKIAQAQN